MKSFAIVALFAFAAQAYAVESEGSADDELIDMLANELVDHLTNRLLQEVPLHDADLDDTVMGKPGAVATRPVMASRPLVRPISAVAPGSEDSPVLPLAAPNTPALGRRELLPAMVAAAAAAMMTNDADAAERTKYCGKGPCVLPWLSGNPVAKTAPPVNGKLRKPELNILQRQTDAAERTKYCGKGPCVLPWLSGNPVAKTAPPVNGKLRKPELNIFN
jgi:hypothetical protein